MSNVSDFKIAAALLREVCRAKKKPFTDVALVFKNPAGKVDGNVLHVGEPKTVGQSLYMIVAAYLNADKQITGSSFFNDENQKTDFLTYVATLFRRIVFSDQSDFEEAKPDSLFVQKLYQRPVVWTIMKNLISPVFEVPLRNITITAGTSPFVDVAHYFKEGEARNPNAPPGDFVFVNDDVENEAVKNAILFIEVLKAHELSPTQVINDLFQSDLYLKFLGILKLCLSKNEMVEEFLAVLFSVVGLNVNLYPHVSQKDGNVVTAQTSTGPQTVPMQWWYMGLTEKMLDPNRGFNWNVREGLEPMVTEFWDQVELIKSRKRQGDGVAFNDLLRLKQMQTSDPPKDATQTLQSLLSEQRIWQ